MKLFAISYVVCLFACMAAGLVAVHPEQGSGTGSRDDLAPPERSTVIRNGTAEFIASSILDKRHEATWTASKMECGPRNDEYSVNEALTKESIDALRGKGGVYTLQRHACPKNEFQRASDTQTEASSKHRNDWPCHAGLAASCLDERIASLGCMSPDWGACRVSVPAEQPSGTFLRGTSGGLAAVTCSLVTRVRDLRLDKAKSGDKQVGGGRPVPSGRGLELFKAPKQYPKSAPARRAR
ncbi:hypothetical protein ACCO45_010696 [Purpureocillium lilacinum]|uniref:Uncharacterized protein n=1 Tax=Purpureocillium lilacinum TaxID=33203 RepID=A0ACC4DIL1_PURLI